MRIAFGVVFLLFRALRKSERAREREREREREIERERELLH